MPKPTVSVELTEKELTAIFRALDKHPSITAKISDALDRIGPVKREHNRQAKAERTEKAYRAAQRAALADKSETHTQAGIILIKSRVAGFYTDRKGFVWTFLEDRWMTKKPENSYNNVIFDENFYEFILDDIVRKEVDGT